MKFKVVVFQLLFVLTNIVNCIIEVTLLFDNTFLVIFINE